MLYVVIESFKDPVAVYRRFRDRGRMAPNGLSYVNSWVTPDVKRCYQVMECADRSQLDAWLARWNDLVDFEVIAVITSAEAFETIKPRL
ncbi:MAG: hypothetical protein DMF59_14605 [Acidobacteria bacterium]|nr:MAG: hypothetical protein DMF59_14605 [Acidobacteriota bacterium]